METIKPDWYSKLSRSPFVSPGFSRNLMFSIEQRSSVRQKQKEGKKLYLLFGLAAFATVIILLSAQINLPGKLPPESSITAGDSKDSDGQWMANQNLQYFVGKKQLLSLMPDPELKVGFPFNYKLAFLDPTVYSDEARVHIVATNEETREEIVSYNNFNGLVSSKFVTFRLGIPTKGLWNFNVYLNDRLYGNIHLLFPDPPWEVSPFFQSGSYKMHGVDGVLGFIDAGFIAGKTNKYVWHFWGKPGELKGKLKVIAVQKDTGATKVLFSAQNLGGKHNGADANIPSSMMLPTQGLWRLMAFVDNKLLGSVVVEVK